MYITLVIPSNTSGSTQKGSRFRRYDNCDVHAKKILKVYVRQSTIIDGLGVVCWLPVLVPVEFPELFSHNLIP